MVSTTFTAAQLASIGAAVLVVGVAAFQIALAFGTPRSAMRCSEVEHPPKMGC